MRCQTLALLLCLGCLSGLACQTPSTLLDPSQLNLSWLSGTWIGVTHPEARLFWNPASPEGIGGFAQERATHSLWTVQCRSQRCRLYVKSFGEGLEPLNGFERARAYELVEQAPYQARFASIESHFPRFIEFRYKRSRASTPALHILLESCGIFPAPSQTILYRRT